MTKLNKSNAAKLERLLKDARAIGGDAGDSYFARGASALHRCQMSEAQQNAIADFIAFSGVSMRHFSRVNGALVAA